MCRWLLLFHCISFISIFFSQFFSFSLSFFSLFTAGELGNAVQDAFVIAVEQQARERLQRLSALKRITPVDMSQLSIKVSETKERRKKNHNRQLNGKTMHTSYAHIFVCVIY